jgi:hypothetical protein
MEKTKNKKMDGADMNRISKGLSASSLTPSFFLFLFFPKLLKDSLLCIYPMQA